MTCEETRTALGAYVLGALEPEERREVRDHLSVCSACAQEYAELEPLPALLDRVSLADLQAEPVRPSPDLFERVASAAAAEGRERAAKDRRVRRRWLVAAVATVVLLGGGVGAAVWLSRDVTTTHSVMAGDLHVTVRATEDEGGTILDLTVDGLPPRTGCWLFAVDEAGAHHDAGWWTVDYEGEGSFRGWTDVPRSELAELLLRDEQDDVLVRVPL